MRLTINGQPIEVPAGSSVAAALAAAGQPARRSVTGEARGPLCAMGICFECRVTINGQPHQRSCQIQALAGMTIATSDPAATPAPVSALSPVPCSLSPAAAHPRHPPSPAAAHPRHPLSPAAAAPRLLVLGAGPAGLAAAARAAEAGAKVVLIDDNPALGGQIWRGTTTDPRSEAARWAQRVKAAQVTVLCATRIVDAPAPGRLLAESPDGPLEFGYQRLLLATGARERFLPFPGWTLPHVLGAGGLQAMVKAGLPIQGKRVVVAGTGPLLLAVAAYLRQHGAQVVAVCDQASWSALLAFSARLPLDKIFQGVQLSASLRGVPLWRNAWPVATRHGAVTISHRGRARELACDYLACGFHLVPNAELAALLGCSIQDGCVVVNPSQETTVAGVYCAGEPTGVGGVELAVIEGEIAGLAMANQPPEPALLARRAHYCRFARRLDRLCQLRPALRTLAQPDTLVCRCEDVSFRRLQAHDSWRAAKLHTRCGMGPCQGRVCGPAAEFLFGWQQDSVRPPIFPADIATLSGQE